MRLPATGLSRDEIFDKLETYRSRDVDGSSGRVFGYVFDPGSDVREFADQVYTRFLSQNALDFTVYPSVLDFENDLVSILRTHLRGDEAVVGNFTSGGTESILLAVKAARDYYRTRKPDIVQPEMILPSTAHAAFHKAAHYFGLKPVTVAVNPRSFKADIESIQSHIGPNTVFMAGSAPSYTQGVIDPIAELSELALRNDIWFHTDACMGGFLLPYFKRLGRPVPDFDFSLDGVRSISVDLHKYAYAPKGASLILYKNAELRRHQMFAFTGWLGYTMINPTIQSTRSMGPLAAAWAVLHYIGDEGYLDFARQKLQAVEEIKRGIEGIAELYLLAEPDMTLLSFSSRSVNVFHIIDEMAVRGWYIQPSFSFNGIPANIHLSVNLSNVGNTGPFIDDLRQSVAAAKALPSGELLAAVKDLIAREGENILSRSGDLMELAGMGKGGLPERTAPINEVLDALPPHWRETILLDVTNRFFQP